MRRICVFAGANAGARQSYSRAAKELGGVLCSMGVGLVYGGGAVGLMGVIADAVLASGGEAIGVIPEALVGREVAHSSLTELRIVGSMHERKAQMGSLSDAFLALPGGLGTMDELMEAATWSQLGIHRKPCGLLNVDGYWDPLIAQMRRAERDGFLRQDHSGVLLVGQDPRELVERMKGWEPPPSIRDRSEPSPDWRQGPEP